MKFRTYLAKTNVNGNRATLILEETNKVYVRSGGHLGEHGVTKTKLKLKDIKEVEEDILSQGYNKITWEEMSNLIFKS